MARDVEYVILRPTRVVDIDDLVELGGWSKAKKQRVGARHAHHIYIRDVADAILWFMERGLSRDKPSPGLSTFNLSEDDTPINTYGQIFKAAYEASGDRRWRVAPIPWPAEWLWTILSFRRLSLRQPAGRVLFSGDRLREEGYTIRFGMSHAIDIFCKKLASTGTTRSASVPARPLAADTTPARAVTCKPTGQRAAGAGIVPGGPHARVGTSRDGLS